MMVEAERVGEAPAPHAQSRSDILLDGLFTGAIGAIAVAAWFFVLDLIEGRPLYTPALLGTVILHGSAVAHRAPIYGPVEIVAYTAVHFLAFTAAGLLLSWLMGLFERFPIVGFVLLVVFVGLQLGFFALNAALGAELLGRLPIWSVVVANLLAAAGMALYQWKRHPGVLAGVDRMWDET